MAHNIDQRSYPENVDRAQVKAELDHFVSMEDWQEGCSGLYRPIRWIETVICDDYEKAVEYIANADRGDYDNVAVRYYNFLPYFDAKSNELQDKKDKAYKKYRDAENVVYPKTVKAAYITCKVCGSKLSRVKLTGNYCPFCKNNLCPDSHKEKVKAAKDRFIKASENLRKYVRSKAKKEVLWLVKFEYHT